MKSQFPEVTKKIQDIKLQLSNKCDCDGKIKKYDTYHLIKAGPTCDGSFGLIIKWKHWHSHFDTCLMFG